MLLLLLPLLLLPLLLLPLLLLFAPCLSSLLFLLLLNFNLLLAPVDLIP